MTPAMTSGLWNAAVKYQPEWFLTDSEAETERQQWDTEQQQKKAEEERQQKEAEEQRAGEGEQTAVQANEPQSVKTVSGNE